MIARRRRSPVAALLLGVLGLSAATGDAAAVRDRSAARAAEGVAPSLHENFAVLRRPRTAADHLPRSVRPLTGCTGAQSRLVADSDGVRAWIVPGTTAVCLIVRARSGWGSQGAGAVETTTGYRSGRRPLGSLNVGPLSWSPHRRLLTLLLPDGTRNVRLHRGPRVVRTLTVERNAIQVRPRSATSIWWRAPDGTRRHLTLR